MKKLHVQQKENLGSQYSMFVVLRPEPWERPTTASRKVVEESPLIPMRQGRIGRNDQVGVKTTAPNPASNIPQESQTEKRESIPLGRGNRFVFGA